MVAQHQLRRKVYPSRAYPTTKLITLKAQAPVGVVRGIRTICQVRILRHLNQPRLARCRRLQEGTGEVKTLLGGCINHLLRSVTTTRVIKLNLCERMGVLFVSIQKTRLIML